MPTHNYPFPGMNPYFQAHWSDVHTRLIAYISDVLSLELPDDLSARAEERIVVEGDQRRNAFRADGAIIEPFEQGFPPLWQPVSPESSVLTASEPIVLFDEEETERWLEIRDDHREIITVIEVLSPANKSGDGADEYKRKQRDVIAAGVALVEIDLIRGGNHVTAFSRERIEMKDNYPHVCVTRLISRGAKRREVYLAPLRESLPTVRIPLRQGDPDVPLALQSLIEKCFQNGRYWQEDYTQDPHPPVAPEDAAWVAECLRAEGLRA